MMMMSFIAMATISVAWVLWGYSETFGSSWHGLVGNPFEHAGLSGVLTAAYGSEGHLIPGAAFVAFQVVFAIIAVALISGAIADRARFLAWTVFTVVPTVVYFPVAHWVFAFDGYAAPPAAGSSNGIKAVDFAGGTAIHINAGAAGLALALVLGARTGFAREPMRPHNLTLVMTGAGILWFGGSGSTPARPSGRQPRGRRLGQHPRGHRCRGPRLVGGREARDGHATSPRWRFRCGGRARRDHAVLLDAVAGGVGSPQARRGRRMRHGRGAQSTGSGSTTASMSSGAPRRQADRHRRCGLPRHPVRVAGR